MRVIGGIYRSRSLEAPRGFATRPTSDRLRETLFDILGKKIEGALFADLYAGSGAVGIEALSRGAGAVCFVENAPPALAAIRANLASLKIQYGYRIDPREVSLALRGLARNQQRAEAQIRLEAWNLIFLDPPYEAASAYSSTLTILGEPASSILAPGCTVIAEHSRKSVHTFAESYGLLRRVRVLEQGDAALSFYEAVNPEL